MGTFYGICRLSHTCLLFEDRKCGLVQLKDDNPRYFQWVNFTNTCVATFQHETLGCEVSEGL